MPHITVQQAQAWASQPKLTLGSLDTDLETQLAAQVLGRVAMAYDVSGWSNEANTPELVQQVIAMMYMAWYYRRVYSEDEPNSNEYATLLMAMAEDLLSAIIAGQVLLPEDPLGTTQGEAVFYPTDASSAQTPTVDDPSLGPEVFSMGTVW
jgi:hypothetical protein